MASAYFGGMLFSILYTDVISPDISGCFFMIAIVNGVCFGAGVIFNVKVDQVSDYEPVEFMDVKEDRGYGMISPNEGGSLTPVQPFWKSVDYYIVLVMCGIGNGVTSAVILLFSTYAESVSLKDHMTTLLTMSPLITTVSLLLLGILSDWFLDKLPRMSILCALHLVMTAVTFLSIFFLDNLIVLITLAIVNGAMLGGYNCLVIPELHKHFGGDVIGITFGLPLVVGASFVFFCQFLASTLYDKELIAQESDDNVCYGSKCFNDWSVIQTCLFAFCLILNILYLWRGKYRTRVA